MQYDLVITGAHVLDPARGIDRVTSVAVKNGKIAAVGDEVDPSQATQVVRAEGKYLSPGWIDMHVHTYNFLAFSHPDTIGVLHGVTTVVDAGGGGAWTYEDCRRYWEGRCKTDIYAFVMFNAAGIYVGRQNVLDEEVNARLAIPLQDWQDVVGRNRDRILMVKTAAITQLGMTPIHAAHQIAHAVNLPVYMHIGDQLAGMRRGTIITREVLDSMQAGDIITHAYTGRYGNLLDTDGTVYEEVWAAKRRGVLFDIGFGNTNFSFEAFDKLTSRGLIADIISSDLQGENVTGPTHSLAHLMSLFLSQGWPLKDVIQRVTINPARAHRLDDRMGSLTPGYPARITVFELQDGEYTFRDCMGQKRPGRTMIVPEFCVMDGELIQCDFNAALVQENWAFLPSLEELPPHAGELDAEQREFARSLAPALATLDWDDGRALHSAFKERVTALGIDERKACDAVYDLFLESRFTVPVGWLLSGFERDIVLHRLQSA